MIESSILIVSTVADIATDAVVRSLTELGVVHRRINTEDFPFERSLTIDFQSERGAAFAFHGDSIAARTIWYRRLRSPARPEGMDPGVYEFCLRENRAALVGGLLTQRVRWMSHPAAIWSAEFKPNQLRAAKEVGLVIPKTVVSNDPQSIRHCYSDFGPLIVKPVRSGHFRQHGKEFSIYTSLLAEEHLEALDDARWAPSIYQQWIPKRFDIRVTYVGARMFSAAIHSQTDPAAMLDWRRTANPALPHTTIELPASVSEKLKLLMQRLNLEFGCIDLVLTPAGEYVFLEVNPSGQWLWLDDQLNFGISDAVAEWLAREGT